MLKPFNRFIIENSTSSATKSECEQKFEQYLFGEVENWYGKKIEDDTEYEKQLFKMLRSFLDGDYREKSKANIEQAFRELLDCKNQYPEVLSTQSPDVIYRGELRSIKDISNIDWQLISEDEYQIVYQATISSEYNSNDIIQSWTTNYDIAQHFADEYSDYEDGNIGVIFIVNNPPEHQLLFNPEFLNKLEKHNKFFDEYEIIRIGSQPLQANLQIVIDKLIFNHESMDEDDLDDMFNELNLIDDTLEDRVRPD